MSQKIKSVFLAGLPAIIIATFLVVAIIYGWTEPGSAPPGGNVPAPLNTSINAQAKEGALVIGTNSGLTTGLIVQYGNVGIGTTSPGAKLDVNGQIKIQGGTPGAGKVLTSDASGLASWQTAGGVSRVTLPGPILNDFTNEPNVRDNNVSTYANVGLSSGTSASFVYDLGSMKGIFISITANLISSMVGGYAAPMSIRLAFSPDNATWYYTSQLMSFSGEGASGINTQVFGGYARYLRITGINSPQLNSPSGSIQINEIVGIVL